METESFRAAARKVGILFDSKAVVRRVLSASFRPGGNLSRYGCLRGISGNLSVCLQVFCACPRAGRQRRADASISKGLKVLEKPRDGILKYNLVVDIIFIVNNPN